MTLRLLVRLFLVQGLWNYRTLLGHGASWVLLPELRRTAPGRGEGLEEALERAAEPFNAHPYLAGFAIGALVRLEEQATPPDEIRRFRDVVRAPLGALGDRLVWAAWLPMTLLAAIFAIALGVGPLRAVIGFLLVYNLLHLVLRWWALSAGLAHGRAIAGALSAARLPSHAERIGRAGVLLLGAIGGFLGVRSIQLWAASGQLEPASTAIAILGGLLLFGSGLRPRREAVDWVPLTMILLVIGLFLAGPLLAPDLLPAQPARP